MLTLKIWCLPEHWDKSNFLELHKKIVQEAISTNGLGIENERNMRVLFPAEQMLYGLGSEILVEISGIMYHPGDNTGKFVIRIGRLLKRLFPESIVLVDFLGHTQGNPYYDSRGNI